MTASDSHPKGPFRIISLIAVLIASLVIVFAVYRFATSRALANEIVATARDPATGVVSGCEAITLEPVGGAESTTRACLLIHGFLGSRKDFGELGKRLAQEGYAVRLMRLPGHATTPDDFAEQTPQSLMHGVRREYGNLKESFDQVDIVGFSMGGTLATLLASEDNPHRLVLVAPYYGVSYRWYYVLPPETWTQLLSPLLPYVIKSKSFTKINRKEALAELYSYSVASSSGVKTLVELGNQARHPDTLEEIRCPVLLLMSTHDAAACPQRARRALEEMGAREKRSVWYSRSNHILLLDHDRKKATREIIRFLDGS